jgi:hypothetical protein
MLTGIMILPGLSALVLLSATALLIPRPATAFQKAPSPKKSSDLFLNGPPFTFEQVLRFVREKAIPQRRQKEAIQIRGLDFSVSTENLQKLEAAGASPDMLDLIVRRAKPLAAPPVVEVTTERIVPATNRGKVLPTTAPVRVDPPQPTKEALGAELFRKMLEALGGQASIPESLWFQAEGSVSVRAGDGRTARWNILIRGRPDRALFQVMAGGVFHEVAFEGSQFKTSKGLKGEDGRDLPTAFGLILDHQIGRVAARLNTPKFNLLAGEPLVLIAESNTETVTVRLDNDMRPAHIKFVTATGLGSGVVTYSDYIQRGNIYYPRSIQIKPDSTPHGVDLHFDRVDLHPKLKDTDYNLNGKRLPSLAR